MTPGSGNLRFRVLHVQPKKREKRECQAQCRGHLQNCVYSLLSFLELSMAPAPLDEWVSRALHSTWSDLTGQWAAPFLIRAN